MGGPPIFDLSKTAAAKTAEPRNALAAAQVFKLEATNRGDAHAFHRHDLGSSNPSHKFNASPQHGSSTHVPQGGFRRTVLVPAMAALVVFVTMKQLATGPKIWQAAQSMAETVQQKVVQVSLKYQPVPVGVSESFALAYEESYGFFDYITDSDWEYRQQLARTRQDHVGAVTADTDNPKTWYMNNYYPAFSCPGLLRLGRSPGPGPKYVCDPQRLPAIAEKRMANNNEMNNGCLIYSAGNPWKFDFEDGLVQLVGDACEIHIFFEGDMGLEKPNMHFHRWSIKSSTENKPGAKSLQETVKELGHEQRVIDVLKIGE